MSIEHLNKAAPAAGFAMATPDDDVPAATPTVEPAEAPASRAVVLAGTARDQASKAESISRMTGWFKAYLPGMGWRAPA